MSSLAAVHVNSDTTGFFDVVCDIFDWPVHAAPGVLLRRRCENSLCKNEVRPVWKLGHLLRSAPAIQRLSLNLPNAVEARATGKSSDVPFVEP